MSNFDKDKQSTVEYRLKVIAPLLSKTQITNVKDALDCPKNSFLNCQLF